VIQNRPELFRALRLFSGFRGQVEAAAVAVDCCAGWRCVIESPGPKQARQPDPALHAKTPPFHEGLVSKCPIYHLSFIRTAELHNVVNLNGDAELTL
jgi:hypothetical protein